MHIFEGNIKPSLKGKGSINPCAHDYDLQDTMKDKLGMKNEFEPLIQSISLNIYSSLSKGAKCLMPN